MPLLATLQSLFRRTPAAQLTPVDDRGSGRGSLIRWEPWFAGGDQSWQADIEIRQDRVFAQATVFACMTLIAADIGKLGLRLMQRGAGDVWVETNSPAFSPVLAKPNAYQTTQQFVELWTISKLRNGNTYALKERDGRGVVIGLYVLDPDRVEPLVAPDGQVYYRFIGGDDLNKVPDDYDVIAPASEVIHDRMICLFHPLVGVTPIFACGLAATQALSIQNNSAKFFKNMSRPSGIITGPGEIKAEKAATIKETWETKFSGANVGRVAVLGNDLKYMPLATTPVDAQLVEQLQLSAEQVCSTFHVPGYKVGVGAIPTYQNAETLNQIYLSDCLQTLIKALQTTLTEGLGANKGDNDYRVHCNLDDLLLMDSSTLATVEGLKVQRGISAPNEARKKFNLPPVDGGDQPLTQQQNYSLEALAKRDASDNPFASAAASPAKPAEPASTPTDDEVKAITERAEKVAYARFVKTLSEGLVDGFDRLEVAL